MGGNLRPRTGGCLHDPERNRAGDCPPVAGDDFAPGKSTNRRAPDQRPRGLRPLLAGEGAGRQLHQRAGSEGLVPKGDPAARRGDGARSRFRPRLLLRRARPRSALFSRPRSDPGARGSCAARSRPRRRSALRPIRPKRISRWRIIIFVASATIIGPEKELALARPGMPNSVPFLTLSGYLHRREGQWEEGKRDFIRAVDLDPRNINASNLLADTYVLLRQFDEAIAVARPKHRRRARPSNHAFAARIHSFRGDRRSRNPPTRPRARRPPISMSAAAKRRSAFSSRSLGRTTRGGADAGGLAARYLSGGRLQLLLSASLVRGDHRARGRR